MTQQLTPKPQFIEIFQSLILPFKLLFDKDVPLKAKLIPTGMFLGYALLPLDIIIDYVPLIGFIDDAAVFTGCAYLIVYLTPPEVLKKYHNNQTTTVNNSKKIIDIEPK
ncbi:DUF1232 domain-containing protein, partial [Patescibacteria group bacterium]|nr:DUF1232 domain-containing protein [Patescibacteria group bacterium]